MFLTPSLVGILVQFPSGLLKREGGVFFHLFEAWQPALFIEEPLIGFVMTLANVLYRL
jgi:hypothetical protein